MPIDLTEPPFNLTRAQTNWVERTLASMSDEQKAGQVLCVGTSVISPEEVERLCARMQVGGVMFRPMPSGEVRAAATALQEASPIPMLLAANLESGGNGIATDGTYFAMPGGVAATGDLEDGYRLGRVATAEAAAVGVNWAFAPVVDVDLNYRNPITNVRSFGSDPGTVAELASQYLRAARESDVATAIKHFPGDGVDERDQHLLVSVNSLPADQWWQTSGAVYSRLVAEGAPTVMVGHIAAPAVAREIDPSVSAEQALLPGTLSPTLLDGLLRRRLGFNGLVITDSTLMVGFMQTMPRRQAVPLALERGCDMILFNRNLEEDYQFILQGLACGLLSRRRLDEAVTRILALKASLRLPDKKALGTLVPADDAPVADPDHTAWAVACADKAVTLVKDRRGLLPLSPHRGRRVYLNVIENYVRNDSPFALDIAARLEAEGFEVTLRPRELSFDPDQVLDGPPSEDMRRVLQEVQATTDDFVSRYDLCVIVLNMETVSNATVVRVDWKVIFGMGNDIPWYAGEMPIVAVSTANPYHLLDVPMAHAFVNAYSNSPATLDAVVDKLMGRSDFTGVSPSDPFCGHEDCAL